MLERARRALVGRVVVDRALGEHPVLDVRRGPGRVDEHRAPPGRRQQEPHGDHGGGHDHGRRRQQPLEDPEPVPTQVHAFLSLQPADQAAGEEERGEEEEHVHTAGDPPQPHVVGDDEQHRERTEALDVVTSPGRGTSSGSHPLIPRQPDDAERDRT
nr:hypothetical protein [Phycicoccus sp. CSK15P-2]